MERGGGNMFTRFDEEMMRAALSEAAAALRAGEIAVGCVIARGGEIIARAHNDRGSDPTGHAEILAIRQAARAIGDWRLADCTLYVTLEPCPMCAGAIVMARVGRLVFGAYDPQYGCAGSVYRIRRSLFRTSAAQTADFAARRGAFAKS